MDEGLGELGFWLMIGMIVAAMIVSGGIKERDRAREKQVTLRALLEKEGSAVTEVLAYMREKDASEAAAAARDRARSDEAMKRWKRTWGKAIAIGISALAGGYLAGTALHFGPFRNSESDLIPLATMFAIWMLGLIMAWRSWRSAKQKNDARPDA